LFGNVRAVKRRCPIRSIGGDITDDPVILGVENLIAAG
jgi:hypothetical protein